jgi:chromate transport protein ChrA
MKNIFLQSLRQYAKGSNTNIVLMFTVVGLIAAGLTFLYVYFVARHHQDNFFISYLMPAFLLAAGIAFGFIARRKRGDWSAIAFAVLAVFFSFGAIISFLVTLLLLMLYCAMSKLTFTRRRSDEIYNLAVIFYLGRLLTGLGANHRRQTHSPSRHSS